MKKAKVVPPVRTFVPDVPGGGKELGFILAILWATFTSGLFFCFRANGFGFHPTWPDFVFSTIFQVVFGLMPILYVVALMRWKARVGLSFFGGLVILPIVFSELYFLSEERDFREEVRQTNPTELAVERAAPFSFATMTYDDEYGYWTYGWFD